MTFETHEELISKAFTIYRNSARLNQNLSDIEIVNKLRNMTDGFLYGFIEMNK